MANNRDPKSYLVRLSVVYVKPYGAEKFRGFYQYYGIDMGSIKELRQWLKGRQKARIHWPDSDIRQLTAGQKQKYWKQTLGRGADVPQSRCWFRSGRIYYAGS